LWAIDQHQPDASPHRLAFLRFDDPGRSGHQIADLQALDTLCAGYPQSISGAVRVVVWVCHDLSYDRHASARRAAAIDLPQRRREALNVEAIVCDLDAIDINGEKLGDRLLRSVMNSAMRV